MIVTVPTYIFIFLPTVRKEKELIIAEFALGAFTEVRPFHLSKVISHYASIVSAVFLCCVSVRPVKQDYFPTGPKTVLSNFSPRCADVAAMFSGLAYQNRFWDTGD